MSDASTVFGSPAMSQQGYHNGAGAGGLWAGQMAKQDPNNPQGVSPVNAQGHWSPHPPEAEMQGHGQNQIYNAYQPGQHQYQQYGQYPQYSPNAQHPIETQGSLLPIQEMPTATPAPQAPGGYGYDPPQHYGQH
jgi:poly(3-hydroxybutyrate) depolymerase